MLTVLSLGGGVNSTALLFEARARGVRIDLVLFADTGGEKPSTYEHVDAVNTWCKRHDILFERVTNGGRGQGETLEENCLMRKELPSLAYGFKGCSVKWKRQPMDRFLRNWEPARIEWTEGRHVHRFIGIDAGEAHRAALTEDAKFRYHYPLVQWGIDRDGCVAIIEREGFRVPEKSSCFFCPAMRKPEVLELAKNHPELAARAVALEANAVTHTVVGLGRRWKWADLIRSDDVQLKLFSDTVPESPCGCHDEDDTDGK